jgi:starvation-inducible DNA-binding protein
MDQSGKAPDTMHLLADHEALIRYLREDGKKCIEEYEDECTYDLLVSVIRRHEKMAWMLRSYVETESTST